MLVSPEIVIFSFLKNILEQLRKGTIDDDWFDLLFSDLKIGNYAFAEQAKEIFKREKGHTRIIDFDLTYNKKTNTPVNLFLSLGSDTPSQGYLGMSLSGVQEDEGGRMYFQSRFDQSISLYIYTDNSNETLVIYYVLKSILLASQQLLDFKGFKNLRLSGTDIAEYPHFVPSDLFYRVINLRFNYEDSVPNFNTSVIAKCLNIE